MITQNICFRGILLLLFFVCVIVVLYAAFILSLFVSQL